MGLAFLLPSLRRKARKEKLKHLWSFLCELCALAREHVLEQPMVFLFNSH